MTIPKLAIAAVISSVAPTAIQPDPSAPSVYGLSLTIINQSNSDVHKVYENRCCSCIIVRPILDSKK